MLFKELSISSFSVFGLFKVLPFITSAANTLPASPHETASDAPPILVVFKKFLLSKPFFYFPFFIAFLSPIEKLDRIYGSTGSPS
jgi:hypothetical protein